jgi:type I restriction enzyme M protein
MLDRKQKAFSDEDTKSIADMFHKFKSNESYEDVAGEYYAATTEEIAKQEYILTPGRYVGVAEEEDDGIPFSEKMGALTATLGEQFAESAKLEEEIRKNLSTLGWKI